MSTHGGGEYSEPIEHCVKGGDLVHTHGRHLEQLCDMVHGRDREPAPCLPLGEVERRDHGGLLVVLGVLFHDLVKLALVVRVKLERHVWVVVGRVAVLLLKGGGLGLCTQKGTQSHQASVQGRSCPRTGPVPACGTAF